MDQRNKRIVLCFDGTWNALDPTQLTNVVKLANLVTVNSDGVEQISYYNSGVGSGGPIDRYLGGLFGAGLKSNVKRGLTFLALNYEAGDEIYLFGFSRGAYTARAVAGVIGSAGIPIDISNVETHWNKYQDMAKLRVPRSSPKWDEAEAAIKELKKELIPLSRNTEEGPDGQLRMVPVRITCVGVWDTVGAYGIPIGFGLSALARSFTYWTKGFRDTHFGDAVKLGLHAVAIDERRRPFAPTFWTRRPESRKKADQAAEKTPEPALPVEQVWFPGVHSNVGGGYTNRGLSDLALAWMMAQVQEKTGLRFNEDEAMNIVWPCSACTLYHTSRGGWFNPIRSVLPPAPGTTGLWAAIRRMFQVKKGRGVRVNEKLHWSVKERLAWDNTLVDNGPPCKYLPSNVPSKAAGFTVPLPLEVLLADHNHPKRKDRWPGKCPMKALNQPCQCAARDFKALGAASIPAAPVTSVAA